MIVIKGDSIVINSKLSRLLRQYIDDVQDVCDDFNSFSDEAILFACLEFSKYIRLSYKQADRIAYLYEKAYLFDKGRDISVESVILDGDTFIVNLPNNDPF